MPAAKPPKPAPKIGRPSTFSQDVADQICDRIADGELLKHILQDEGMPTYSGVRGWRRANSTFDAAYVRAREDQMHAWSEEIIDLADDASCDYIAYQDKDGKEHTIYQRQHVDRVKLRIDTRKYLMGKINAVDFGDKAVVDVNHGLQGKDDAELMSEVVRQLEALGIDMPPHILMALQVMPEE